MRNIEARFKKSQKKEPCVGAYIHLAKAVIYQKFSRKSIVKNFKKLMPDDEYLKSERKVLVDYLEYLTNRAEGVEICNKNNPRKEQLC